ncbi:hypothetical protein [Deinococcus sp. UYEF24]
MSVIMIINDQRNQNFQFSNLIFGGILDFAEENKASSEIVRLLTEGSLFHGVNIGHYSINTQKELVCFMEKFFEYAITRTSDEAYLNHIKEFTKLLSENQNDFRTDFTYLDTDKRFEL